MIVLKATLILIAATFFGSIFPATAAQGSSSESSVSTEDRIRAEYRKELDALVQEHEQLVAGEREYPNLKWPADIAVTSGGHSMTSSQVQEVFLELIMSAAKMATEQTQALSSSEGIVEWGSNPGYAIRDQVFLDYFEQNFLPMLVVKFPNLGESQYMRGQPREFVARYIYLDQRIGFLEKQVTAVNVISNDQFATEAEEYLAYCKSTFKLSGSYNCECLRDEYIIQKHQSPGLTRATGIELNMNFKTCVDRSLIAKNTTSSCMNNGKPLLVKNHEAYCECYGQEVATLVGGASSKVAVSTMSKAMRNCRGR